MVAANATGRDVTACGPGAGPQPSAGHARPAWSRAMPIGAIRGPALPADPGAPLFAPHQVPDVHFRRVLAGCSPLSGGISLRCDDESGTPPSSEAPVAIYTP